MFETFLKAIIISIMLSVILSDNSVLIRDDRVYRYVGNSSDKIFDLNSVAEDDQSVQQNIKSNAFEEESEATLSTTNATQNVSQNIPESILIKLKDIRNASDFIASFLAAEENVNNKDVYLEYLERGSTEKGSKVEMNINEERRKLTKLPKIASPAGCIPEQRIIELQASESHNELYFPSCIRMPRCSGCCPSKRLHCVPVSTSFEDLSVIRVKYSTEEKKLKFNGFKVFRIEKHDNCSCDCIQKATDCTSNQIYSESECRCLCPDISEMNECQTQMNKYWDYSECNCKCKSRPFCSTGLLFSNNSCRCEAEAEEESDSSHSDVPNDTTEVYNKLVETRYVLDKRVDTEIKVQRTKGLDIFNGRGINPDIEDEYHKSTDT